MDDLEEWSEPINKLVAQGLLAPDAVLDALTQRVLNFYVLDEETELPRLHETFESLATEEDGVKQLTQSAFLSFLTFSGFLPPSMRDAGALIYRSLLYLSQYPFYRSIPEALTYEELIRALAWTMPERSRNIYDECHDSRSRSPADFRRQLFQGFATTRDGKSVPFDVEHTKEQAEQRAFNFTGADRRRSAGTNYDDDGDEMFHDILDVLYSVQPKDIGWKAPPRDCFRPIAKELVGDERVHHLSIPQDEFRAILKLLVTTYFGKPSFSFKLADLDHVVDCIICPVIQRSDIGITWNMYEQAAGNGMPMLMRGLQRILRPFYTNSTDENTTIDLPQSGKIATWPVMAQLGSLGAFGSIFAFVQQYKYYDVRTMPVTASALADELDALPRASIAVLLSGKNSKTGKKIIFGSYMPYFPFDESPFLFQLSDIQDAFRGNASRPGRELDGGELVFGQRWNGVALVLQQDVERAIVSHNVSGQNEPMYVATTWRGDWQLEVEVEEIELWIEQLPDSDNEGEEE
ncbi:hypothetical protein SI65_04326 [Aspergillus cristatus]|uniref:Uncharacterized protein n=1 Tax=Aspergillus cristatus TaxID=573508 RepID=A0A1E3BJW3_ASPCR|nr:hypothetical protein SI65_04326 [Aspergillus cristatus]